LNKRILNTVIQEFIDSNLNSNIHSILLKGISFENIETKEIIEQIEAKNKCKNKLPTWFNTKNIYYPNKLNIEQTSSEKTADYKAGIINGNSIIDLAGGFGIDCYYFSKQFKNLVYCEIDKNLSNIVNHNFKQLNASSIKIENTDGIDYLKKGSNLFDWIYVDPSRRNNTKGKVFFLKDCLPNIPDHLELLLQHSKNILIKTSPLLDISIGIEELKYVKTIHVVAVNNEVKELLWILEKDYSDTISIKTVNIKNEKKQHFDFIFEEESIINLAYKKPLSYLYEPNAAIMKAGAFKSIANAYNVSKLEQHSHLYTSNNLLDFPGRSFKIIEVLPYNKKSISKVLSSKKANISTRNFPETVNQIKDKFNIQDGGELYVFFTTNLLNNKIVIITTKI